jgi:hypothetical protein
MSPDEPDGLTIRNRRYPRWPAVLTSAALVVWLTATCAFVVLPDPSLVAVLVGVVAFLAFVVAAVFGAIRRLPVESLKLGNDLRAGSGYPPYRPEEIRQIAFAPDRAEDFAEGRTAAPLCEAAVAFRSKRGLRLIVTVEDARRLRDWAVAKGIEVIEAAGVLGGSDRGS